MSRAAAIKDGYVWGRGSLDDKPVLAANLMTMLLLKRNHVALDRDVIFLAESGEEADTTGVGINFMVNQHYDAIDAEYSITEGGGATIELHTTNGGIRVKPRNLNAEDPEGGAADSPKTPKHLQSLRERGQSH